MAGGHRLRNVRASSIIAPSAPTHFTTSIGWFGICVLSGFPSPVRSIAGGGESDGGISLAWENAAAESRARTVSASGPGRNCGVFPELRWMVDFSNPEKRGPSPPRFVL
jgi:hypothetical protein